MTLRTIVRPLLLSTVVIGAVLGGGAPPPAQGQSAVRPGASPLAPSNSGRPDFDTSTPSYSGTKRGERAGETIVAEVDGRAITLAEVGDRIRQMPQAIANLPFEVLFPNMVEQLVRRQALVLRAQRRGYDTDPVSRRRMQAASDEVLANEALLQEAGQAITEARLQERYRRDHANKPGPEEVHVRVIVVPTEAEASAAIARLKDGADFADLAKTLSKDTSASMGGDLGFLTRDGMNAEVGAVAFVLPPGQVSPYPVRSADSWFVIRTDARRARPTPPYAAIKEQIRLTLLREGSSAVIRAALDGVTVREYDVSGKEFTADPPAPSQ